MGQTIENAAEVLGLTPLSAIFNTDLRATQIRARLRMLIARGLVTDFRDAAQKDVAERGDEAGLNIGDNQSFNSYYRERTGLDQTQVDAEFRESFLNTRPTIIHAELAAAATSVMAAINAMHA